MIRKSWLWPTINNYSGLTCKCGAYKFVYQWGRRAELLVFFPWVDIVVCIVRVHVDSIKCNTLNTWDLCGHISMPCSMIRNYVISPHHLITSSDHIIQSHHSITSLNHIIQPHHLTTSFNHITWPYHSTTLFDLIIWSHWPHHSITSFDHII